MSGPVHVDLPWTGQTRQFVRRALLISGSQDDSSKRQSKMAETRSGAALGFALVLSGVFLLACIPDTRPTVLLQVRTVRISEQCASNLPLNLLCDACCPWGAEGGARSPFGRAEEGKIWERYRGREREKGIEIEWGVGLRLHPHPGSCLPISTVPRVPSIDCLSAVVFLFLQGNGGGMGVPQEMVEFGHKLEREGQTAAGARLVRAEPIVHVGSIVQIGS